MGGRTEGYSPSGTVSCRVDPLDLQAGGEPIVGDRISTTRQVVITVPQGTSLSSTSRIASGGATYEVLNIRAPRSWELSRRVEGVEIS